MIARLAIVSILAMAAAHFGMSREVTHQRCLQLTEVDGDIDVYNWVTVDGRSSPNVIIGSCHSQRFRRQWGIDEIVDDPN